MPRGDRTGPLGMGPRTGRGLGYCAGYPGPGFISPGPGFGFGRGMGFRGGFGRGMGFGRGRAWRRAGLGGFFGYPYPPYYGYPGWMPYGYPFPYSYGYPYGGSTPMEFPAPSSSQGSR
jgi:hypothetical protein